MHTVIFCVRSFRHHVALSLGVTMFIAAFIAMSVSGCGSSNTSGSSSTNSAAPGPVYGGVLTQGISAPTNLDPHFATNAPEEKIFSQIYDWLILLDDTNNTTPCLATEWKM